MLATIRLHKNGLGETLPRPVDLMKFSEEEIRQRLVEYGYDYHSQLLITKIVDWDVERNITLEQAYHLRDLIKTTYAGNDFIVRHLLKNSLTPFSDIMVNRYAFLSKDEEEAMLKIAQYYEKDTLIKLFYKANNWVNLLTSYTASGLLLNTSEGFYWKVN